MSDCLQDPQLFAPTRHQKLTAGKKIQKKCDSDLTGIKKDCQNWPNYLSHLAKTAVKVGQNIVKRGKMNVKIALKTIIHGHCSNVLLQTADLQHTKFV